MMWSVLSSAAPQISQHRLSTTSFLNRFARHWILPFETSHMKNWILGGPEFFHMNSEAGSAACCLALSSLWIDDESSLPRPQSKGDFCWSLPCERVVWATMLLICWSSSAARLESLGTKASSRSEVVILLSWMALWQSSKSTSKSWVTLHFAIVEA